MSNTAKTTASTEVSSKTDSSNLPAQTKAANPDSAIRLVAFNPDSTTPSLATVLFPAEEASSDPKKTKLSKAEKSSLERCEQVIQRGLATFVEVGAALHEIQSQRLYRQQHTSFEAYLTSRWNFKRAHAYRLINAYRVLEKIQDEAGKELSESHVRQLVRLPEDQRAEALRRAKELAGQETRTAKHIQQAVDDLLGKPKKSASKSSDDEADNDGNGGGTPADKPTPPPAPTGGATAPQTTARPPLTVDTALVNELLELVRGTRDLLTIKRDVNAAIQQLFRLEKVLTQPAKDTRYEAIAIQQEEAEEAGTTFAGRLTEVRQRQAA